MGFSFRWLLLLWSTGSRIRASVVVAHGLSCLVTCGIFLDQGSNLCPLHWQASAANSQPLDHEGSPSWGSYYCTTLLPGTLHSALPVSLNVALVYGFGLQEYTLICSACLQCVSLVSHLTLDPEFDLSFAIKFHGNWAHTQHSPLTATLSEGTHFHTF